MKPARMAELHGQSFARGWSEAEISALLAKPTTFAVTAEHGFALLQIIAPDAELLTIVIAPEMRGRGYGKTLLGQTLLTAARNGAGTVFLEVDAANASAIALYDSAGFTRSGRRRAYYSHPDGSRSDAIIMARPIAAQSART